MRRLDTTHILSDVNVRLPYSRRLGFIYLTSFIRALLTVHNFSLQELEIFAEYFDWESVKIDSLTACLVNTMSLLFNLFILKDYVLLDWHHFLTEALDCNEFVVGLGDLNIVKDLQNLPILILNIYQAKLLLFVLADKADKFTTLFDLIKWLDELVCEVFNPFNILFLHFN